MQYKKIVSFQLTKSYISQIITAIYQITLPLFIIAISTSYTFSDTLSNSPHSYDTTSSSIKNDSLFSQKKSPISVQAHTYNSDTSKINANPQPTPDSTAIADSIIYFLKQDSLVALETQRRTFFYPYYDSTVSSLLSIRNNFSDDPTCWYDLSTIKQFYTNAHTGITHCFNRLSWFGNTAPIDKQFYGTKLIPNTIKNPLSCSHVFINQEFPVMSILPSGIFSLSQYPSHIVAPETFIFWENGVFKENILSFKSTRLIGRSLQVSVFSHYTYFADMKYSHDGNDIYTLFASITPDTSVLSHKGYNPLVKEFVCGMDLSWQKKNTQIFSKVKYGDLSNEIPINRPFTDNHPTHARISQYPFFIMTTFSHYPSPQFYIDAEGIAIINNQRINRTVNNSISTLPQKLHYSTEDMSGAIRIGFTPDIADSMDISFRSQRYKFGVPDSIEHVTYTFRPQLRYKHALHVLKCRLTGNINLGTDMYTHADNPSYGFIGKVEACAETDKSALSCFIEKDVNHYYPYFDSLEFENVIHDTYIRTGIMVEHAINRFQVRIGYHYYPDPDLDAIARSWCNSLAPYNQPKSILLFGVSAGRFLGTALQSSVFISDTKPFIKMQNTLSYKIMPTSNGQSIECGIDFIYWSSRNEIIFSDTSFCKGPVFDINITGSTHIKPFRLFYKIDNILNRNFSYLPGYYAPGITFRWGFSWFIQR